MTMNEILALPRKKEDMWSVIRLLQDKFNFAYDFGIDLYDIDFEQVKEFDNIEIHSLYEKMSDHRRGHWIDVISYKNEDAILFFTAGREGDDSKNFKILNSKLFTEMMNSLKVFIKIPDYSNEEVSIEELQQFYGMDLDKEFLDLNLPLKFKVNDIITLPLNINGIETNVRAKVTETDNKSSNQTYEITLTDFIHSHLREKDNTLYPSYSVFDLEINWKDRDENNKKAVKEILLSGPSFARFICNYNDEKKMKLI